MDAKVGDRIIVETERVGMPARAGVILEVIASPAGTHYRVRWDDGHESTFWPAAGSARVVPAETAGGSEAEAVSASVSEGSASPVAPAG